MSVEVVDHCVCSTDTKIDKISNPSGVLPSSQHCVTQIACSRCTFVVCLHFGEMKTELGCVNFIHLVGFEPSAEWLISMLSRTFGKSCVLHL